MLSARERQKRKVEDKQIARKKKVQEKLGTKGYREESE